MDQKKALLRSLVYLGILIPLLCIDWFLLPYVLGFNKDICYYHTHPAPWYIEWFFLNIEDHPELPYSRLNIYLLISAPAGIMYLAEKIRNKEKK